MTRDILAKNEESLKKAFLLVELGFLVRLQV